MYLCVILRCIFENLPNLFFIDRINFEKFVKHKVNITNNLSIKIFYHKKRGNNVQLIPRLSVIFHTCNHQLYLYIKIFTQQRE